MEQGEGPLSPYRMLSVVVSGEIQPSDTNRGKLPPSYERL